MERQLFHTYDHIISVENLLGAWREFIRGKRHRPDVQEFEFRLMDNILSLGFTIKFSFPILFLVVSAKELIGPSIVFGRWPIKSVKTTPALAGF